ncbi:hypothetical protein [Aliikangiella coralliicola]|uniref:Uncharacterized protein n=1 Tax=Aliikangiella coralliicola TaxID=2592383 RepID=A0A545UJP2_9GAMM|nr:hypothetical protein [Aliikangiella coralliicola]TQV89682.1 hypothetical protein FLL46_02030 [Aliikangiella coralliicola]
MPQPLSVSFTFNNGTITCANPSVTAQKGQDITFSMSNDSPTPLNNSTTVKDWGLYFNNPFSLADEQKYAFGDVSKTGTLQVQTDGAVNVPAYNSYIVYVQTEDDVYHVLDPMIVVSDGDDDD